MPVEALIVFEIEHRLGTLLRRERRQEIGCGYGHLLSRGMGEGANGEQLQAKQHLGQRAGESGKVHA